MKSLLRLFKAVEIKSKRRKQTSKSLLKQTLKYGFIFSPEVIFNYTEADLHDLTKIITKEIGLTPEQLNSSFHKSWQKIKEADIEQLVVEQLAHYLTTYGKESPKDYLIEKEVQFGVPHLAEKIIELGDFRSDKINEKDYVYFPKEILDIPEIDIEGINIVVIKGYTIAEIKEKLLDLLGSGIALKEDTVKDVVDVFKFMEIKLDNVDIIKNKEVKIALCDHLKLFPEDPIEFLRFVIFIITNNTLLIKNKGSIEKIKETQKGKEVVKLFRDYEKRYGLEKLSSIFYRFRPIFLAFRHIREN